MNSRTHNRSRSPRLEASSWQTNVGKGSRQNRSVTSGKRLALKAEYMGYALKLLEIRLLRLAVMVGCDGLVEGDGGV